MAHNPRLEMVANWATRLGLAPTPLLDPGRDPGENHFALLDGVEGSLAVSTQDVEPTISLDWTWSSQLANHVQLSDDGVLVRQVDPRGPHLRFEVEQVSRNLERFLDTVIGKRIAPAATVVDHVVSCFRSHRAAAADHGLSNDESLSSFLALVEREITPNGAPPNLDERLPPDHAERLHDELSYNRLTGRHADLALTMRHAAGMVFQETYAELSSEPVQSQLFGLAPSPRRSTRNRLGAYYTPPGLARTLCDVAVAPHLHKAAIRILDPACGSGIFLSEVLRSLQRRNYQGQVELQGLDVSASAIEMAHFALRHNDVAQRAAVRVEVGDFVVTGGNAEADIVLMNPPFIAYQDLTPDHKQLLRRLLGTAFRFRPDFSMLFVTLALDQLREGGTLATLLPSGVLGQRTASAWRSQIAEANDVDLIAVLGDHGLFRDAIVNVAALVLTKTAPRAPTQPTMLWSSQKRGASEAALRRLRRWVSGDQREESNVDWAIYVAPERVIVERDDWTPRPNSLRDLPEMLRLSPLNTTVGRYFHVEQGVRPGTMGEKLIVSTGIVDSLPAGERKYFRPVAENRAIKRGRIIPINQMFFPAHPMCAGEVAEKLPVFFALRLANLNLEPNTLVEAIRPRRSTHDARKPRIISRVYVGTDSFAVDPDGSFIVVQGNSWLPKFPLEMSAEEELSLLKDYSNIFNSRLFFLLLREYGRIVAGGQVEASKATTEPMPIPDLPRIYDEFPNIRFLAQRLRQIDESEYPPISALDAFAAAAYQTGLEEWSLPK